MNVKENDQFETHLRARLQNEVIDLPTPAGPAAATNRARALTRRNRVLAGVAVAFAFVGGITAVSQLRDPSPDSVKVASPGIDDVDTAAADGSTSFAWTMNEGGLSAYAGPFGQTTTESLYSLSTAPGTTSEQFPDGDVPKALYKLDDAGEWQPVEGEVAPGLARLVEVDGVLYGLATGTATGSESATSGAVSTDGGVSWTEVTLNDVEAPSAGDWYLSQRLSMTNTDGGPVAVVSSSFYADPTSLFPEIEVDEEGHLEARPTAAGIEGVLVTGMSEEVVDTATWADLGLSGPEELSDVSVYLIRDGEWTEQPAPEVPAGGAVGTVTSINGKLFATVETTSLFYGSGNPALSGQIGVVTADGIEWQNNGASSYWGVQAFGNKLIAFDYSTENTALVVSEDEGVSWYQLDTSFISSQYGASGVFVGPLGVVVTSYGQDNSQVHFTSDLANWSELDLSTMVEGVDLSTNDYLGVLTAMVGTDRVALTVDRAGPGVVTVVGSPIR